MLKFGTPYRPPFRSIGKDVEMLESYPSYFWVVSRFIQPLSIISDELPRDAQIELIGKAKHGLEMFSRPEYIHDLLPRTNEKAEAFLAIVNGWFSIFTGQAAPGSMGTL